jgi:hypothetical protein
VDSASYPPPCAVSEQGAAGQATRIAAATTGVVAVNPTGSSLAATIIAALNALPPVPVMVTPSATCDPGLTTSFNPASQTVNSGSTANFQETITVTAALPGVTLGCTVDFLINGANAGTAFRQTVTITVGFPPSTEGCKVTQGGWITTSAGDRANFGGNAHVPPSGHENYVDVGTGMHVSSIDVRSVVCDAAGTMASIFGTATVDGSGPFVYRIDVVDNGEPGTSDRYQLRLSNGYDSGNQQLEGGNVQIHS